MFQRSSQLAGSRATARRAATIVATAAIAVLLRALPASGQLPAPPVSGPGLVQLGGYAALTLTHTERPETSERPDVSELVAALMAWGQVSTRASYLVELDLAKRSTETWTGRESDRWLLPVRAYLEYAAGDLLRVRAGRFLTPVGQWNEHHAEPLTWTPTRPLTTYHPFAKSVTGLMVAGAGSVAHRDVGYALFWAPAGDLGGNLSEDEESRFVRAVGGRVAAEVHGGLTLGVSAAGVRRSQPYEPGEDDEEEGIEHHERHEETDARPLLGADLRWEGAAMELSAEGTWLPADEHARGEGGAFAQAAVHLHGPLWMVGRAEAYRLPDATHERLGFAGVALRASPHAVVKLGWQFSRRPSARIPDGWFLSFSSLF